MVRPVGEIRRNSEIDRHERRLPGEAFISSATARRRDLADRRTIPFKGRRAAQHAMLNGSTIRPDQVQQDKIEAWQAADKTTRPWSGSRLKASPYRPVAADRGDLGTELHVIRFGLDEFTPFAFAAWRFILGALPVLFIPKPAASWKALAGMGAFLFGASSSFLLRHAGRPAGRASPRSWSSCGTVDASCSRPVLKERATIAQWGRPRRRDDRRRADARTVEGDASVLPSPSHSCPR